MLIAQFAVLPSTLFFSHIFMKESKRTKVNMKIICIIKMRCMRCQLFWRIKTKIIFRTKISPTIDII